MSANTHNPQATIRVGTAELPASFWERDESFVGDWRGFNYLVTEAGFEASLAEGSTPPEEEVLDILRQMAPDERLIVELSYGIWTGIALAKNDVQLAELTGLPASKVQGIRRSALRYFRTPEAMFELEPYLMGRPISKERLTAWEREKGTW